MTQQEFEQKKAECWHEYFSSDKQLTTTHEHEVSKDAFYAAFDRAYALGKQEGNADDGSLWSRLTDDEKREMQCRYHTNEFVLRDHKKRTGDKAQTRATARMKLLENLFGKDNLKVEKK